jgi:hypothetical protein
MTKLQVTNNNIEHEFLVVKSVLSHPRLKIFFQARFQIKAPYWSDPAKPLPNINHTFCPIIFINFAKCPNILI